MSATALGNGASWTLPVTVDPNREASAQLISNGDFGSGETFWTVTGAISHSVVAGQENISVAGGLDPFACGLKQNVTIDKAGFYRAEFDAQASLATQINVSAAFTNTLVNLTTSLVHYVVDMPSLAVTPGAQFALFLGGNAAGVNFIFDNISFVFMYYPVRVIDDASITGAPL